jgi:hypothetical protein
MNLVVIVTTRSSVGVALIVVFVVVASPILIGLSF